MAVKVGAKAPNLHVSTWVQGKPTNIDQEKGNVVVVEVFQVNCPGCFMYGIPEAIELYNKYRESGLTVLGMATAFEDYDKNTLENLQKLLMTGEVIGETQKALSMYGQLKGGKLPYKIPFPVGMDMLKKENGQITESKIMDVIEANVPDYRSYSEKDKRVMIERVKMYLQGKEYSAKTFEEYAMRGTPTSLVIDKKGNLRHNLFGATGYLETIVEELLKE
ncbi:peroxiredoxin family protein [Nitrososphaera viennensis]|uniref:Alkyl hydroperoxide reductase/thiol specific antioxidant family protein n=2 Tax=Nitrososphaera viennensis TaxID=1034015 RepID=A0A060HH72_9ARCH|nr:redoxin domain-containing protein [Nitrososphaera viennensis]AIC14710.1 alkyl hydroperoxide reductase/thiol specific antioxidant family protein [Nitrososphaera viennensis EN76]UVS69673.1 redoxin domain-containing protein [Nitrososphaera viennensis]